MLLNRRHWGAPLGHTRLRTSAKLISLVGCAASCVLTVTCALILTCTAGALAARAQDPPKPPPVPNVEDDTKKALALEWTDTARVRKVLYALEWLTGSSPPRHANREALRLLADGNAGDWDLYGAAMGDPDDSGRPRVQGLPSFLDILATANNLGAQKSDSECECACNAALFDSTKAIISGIYGTVPGKHELVEINDLFSRKDSYVALYRLLRAHAWDKDGNAAYQQQYASDLEKIRAAFALNAGCLAKQVAATISSAKKN